MTHTNLTQAQRATLAAIAANSGALPTLAKRVTGYNWRCEQELEELGLVRFERRPLTHPSGYTEPNHRYAVLTKAGWSA